MRSIPLVLSATASLVLLLVLACLPISTLAAQRRSQSEWNKRLNDEDDYRGMLLKEHKMDEEVLGKVEVAQPAILYVTFPPGTKLEKKAADDIATRWSGMLQSAAVRVSIWGAGESQLMVAAFRETDVSQVVEFLLQQPDVMKVTHQYRDWWNLPKYKKEMEAGEKEKREKMDRDRRRMEEARSAGGDKGKQEL